MRRTLALIGLVLSTASSLAAEKDFSSWRKFTEGRLISETSSISPGGTAHVGLHITLADRWHTYWVNPGDSGAAINLRFKNSQGLRVKAVHMPVPERFQTGPLISFAYGKEVVFPIVVDVAKSATVGAVARMEVEAEWLVCDDVCIPAVDTFTLDLPVTNEEDVRPSENFGLFQKYMARLPKPTSEKSAFEFSTEAAILKIKPWPEGFEFVEFFPFRGSGVTNERPIANVSGNEATLTFKKANVPQVSADRVGVLLWAARKDGGLVEAVQIGEPNWSFVEEEGAATGLGSHIWWMLLSAFLGGLILNLMPCVFPILSIKLLSLLKVSSKSAGLIRQQNAGYVLGVILSFLVIGIVLSILRQAGHLVGWGFQLQSPVFLALLSWLFFALALNLVGLFEIEFIDAGVGGRWTRLGGFWGSFFTGVLAVVVASPCTAPFMGVALGFGLSQSTPVLLAIFFALGLGLAFPYALMMAVPSALWFLPKPGPWMIRLKKFMAFPMLLTIAWLVWVLYQISGGASVTAVVVGCVVLGVAIVFLRPKRLAAGVATAFLAGLLAFVYSAAQATGGEKILAGQWQPFSESRITELAGQNVFVNLTADWCLTCKVNERLIFSDPEVVSLLEAKKVNLIMGDWTRPNPEITRFLNKYSRAGVPFYIFFSARNPNGRILPEVMTKSTFIELVQEEFP